MNQAMPARTGPAGLAVAAVLCLLVAIGGAGAGYPRLATVAEAAALVLLALAAVRCAAGQARFDPLETALLLLIVLTPLAQLIPWPFAVWVGLPGRELPAAILTAAGPPPATMPLSLDRDATVAALLALLPGVAMFVAARTLGEADRRRLAQATIGLAAVSACLGAGQLALGAPSFASAHAGQGIGLFVDRNHQAALLLVAICLTAPGGARAAVRHPWAALGLIVILAAGVLATTSRTGLALLPLSLLPGLSRFARWRQSWRLGAGGATVAVAGAVWWGGALTPVLDRFGHGPDVRWTFWQTTWEATQAYWPAGSGLGSFASVYPVFEARSTLAPFVVNHAHNDWLELVLETGAIAAVGFVLFGWWFVRRWRAGDGGAPGVLAGLAVLLAFSLVEYPLRMLSLMAVFGLLCALTAPGGGSAIRRGPAWAALATASAGVAALAAALFLSPRAPAQPRLTHAPLDQAVVTSLARSREDDDALAGLTGRLGWRDPATQFWLFARAMDAGDAATAAVRADALLRTGHGAPGVIRILRLATGDAGFRAAFAGVLAERPAWRTAYLTRLGDLDPPLAPHRALLAALAARGAAPSFDERAAFVRRALALGDTATAAQVWTATAPPGLLPDPGLRRIDRDLASRDGLFGWHVTDIGGVTVESEGATSVLAIDTAASGLLLYQDVLLPPGRYRFAPPLAADGLGWSVTCAADGARLDTAGDAGQTAFTVPPSCPVQRIGLRSQGSGLDTVRLRAGTATLGKQP